MIVRERPLPCPSCGNGNVKTVITGHPAFDGDSTVVCDRCGKSGPSEMTLPDAVHLWNCLERQVEQPQPVDALSPFPVSDWWHC